MFVDSQRVRGDLGEAHRGAEVSRTSSNGGFTRSIKSFYVPDEFLFLIIAREPQSIPRVKPRMIREG